MSYTKTVLLKVTNNSLLKEDLLNCSCYDLDGARQIRTFRRNLLLISVESNLSVEAAESLETWYVFAGRHGVTSKNTVVFSKTCFCFLVHSLSVMLVVIQDC